jgi:hypothetical protein
MENILKMKNRKINILIIILSLIVLISLIVLVKAILINSLTDSSTNGLLMLDGSNSFTSTKYISIYRYADVTNATINLNGYPYYWIENSTAQTCVSNTSGCGNAWDGSWATTITPPNYQTWTVYENYSLVGKNYVDAYLKGAGGCYGVEGSRSLTISYFNYTLNNWATLGVFPFDNATVKVPTDGMNNVLQIKGNIAGSSGGMGFGCRVTGWTETALILASNDTGTSLTNPSLNLGEPTNPVWNYSGQFNLSKSPNKTSDFSSKMDQILSDGCICSTCSLSGDNCSMGLIFKSDTEGFFAYDNINVNYVNSQNIKVNLTSPNDNYWSNVTSDQTFSCTGTSNIFNLTSVTFYLWKNDNLIYSPTNTITGLTNSSDFTYSITDYGSYKWNCQYNSSDGSSFMDSLNKSLSFSNQTSIRGCRDINQSGNYTLSNDVWSRNSCLNFYADNINLDCKNKTIYFGGESVSNGIYVYSSHNNIYNCRFSEIDPYYQSTGIYFSYPSGADNIVNNTIADVDTGISVHSYLQGVTTIINISNNIIKSLAVGGGYYDSTITNINNNVILDGMGFGGYISHIGVGYILNNVINCTTNECINNGGTIQNNTLNVLGSGLKAVDLSGGGQIFTENTINLYANDTTGIYIHNYESSGTYTANKVNTMSSSITTTGFVMQSSYAVQSSSYVYNNFFNTTTHFNKEMSIFAYPYWNYTSLVGLNVVNGSRIGGNYWAKPNGQGFSETCFSNPSEPSYCLGNYTLENNGGTDYLPLTTNPVSSVTLVSPINNSVAPAQTSFICNSTNFANLVSMDFYIWNSGGTLLATNTTSITGKRNLTTFSYIFPSSGTYYWTCRDTNVYNMHNTASNFSLIVDTNNPIINYIYPSNNQFTNNHNININCSVLGSNLGSLFLYGDFNGTFSRNKSISGIVSGNNYGFTLNNLPDNVYTWACAINKSDTGALFFGQQGNYTIGIDSTSPVVTINEVASSSGSQTIYIDAISSDTHISTCKYSIYNSNGTIDGLNNNVSYTCNSRFLATVTEYGSYNIVIYARDSAGNENLSSFAFTVSQYSPVVVSGGSVGGVKPQECNINLVRPTKKIVLSGSNGEVSSQIEFIVENSGPLKDSFIFSLSDGLKSHCKIKTDRADINGKSTFTNWIQCDYTTQYYEGLIEITSSAKKCDSSLSVEVSTSFLGKAVSWFNALLNGEDILVFGVLVPSIVLFLGLILFMILIAGLVLLAKKIIRW